MREFNKIYLSKQRGAVALVLAVLLIPVMVVLIALGIDITRSKNASSVLRREVEYLCRDVSFHVATQKQAASIFRDRVQQLVDQHQIPSAMITEAKLIIPTMTASFAATPPYFWRDGAGKKDLMSEPSNPFNFGQSGTAIEFQEAGIGACALDNGDDCKFIYDVSNESKYPLGLWSNIEDAGATLACELTATIDRIVPTALVQNLIDINIVAKTVILARPPRVPGYDPLAAIDWVGDGVNDPVNIPFRPLTIAVATELETPAFNAYPPGNDPFLFTFSNGSQIYSTEMQQVFNPVYGPNSGYLNAANFHLFNGSSEGPFNQTGITPITSYDNNNYRFEQVVGCINPLVLARNIFIQTITELASRHGLYRFNTETLHIAPEVGAVQSTNPPTYIAEFGQDIAKAQFQPPYVLVPNTDRELAAPTTQYDARRLAQLRSCYHIYHEASPTSNEGTALQPVPSNILDNHGFEPSGATAPFHQVTGPFVTGLELSNIPINENLPTWSEDGAWSLAPTGQKRNLTLSETLGSLGTTQACPISGDLNVEGNCNGSKGSAPTIPDFTSLVNYLTKSGAPNYALKFPGYWNPYTSPSTNNTAPFSMDAVLQATTPNQKSLVLIITHYAPSNTDATTISALLTANDPTRIFKIIYIPPTNEQTIDLTNLQTAFNIPADQGPFTSEIYYLSPGNIDLPKIDYITSCTTGGCAPSTYAQYWHDLLDPSSPVYIAEFARKFFYERLAMPVVKY